MKRRNQSVLEKLRERPHHERRFMALGAAGSVTGMIALFWIVSMSTTLEIAGEESAANVHRAAQNLEVIKDRGAELYTAFEDLKKTAPPDVQQNLQHIEQELGIEQQAQDDLNFETEFPTFPEEQTTPYE